MKKEGLLTRIITVLSMVVLIFNLLNTSVYAWAAAEPTEPTFNLGEIFDRGDNIAGSNDEYEDVEKLVTGIGTSIVKPIGYLIFAIITVVLGVQYIWSGYNGKSKVKESLPVFICSVVFFYLADNVFNIVAGIIGYNESTKTFNDIVSFNNFTGNIWVNVCNVVQILAFAGILFIGVKYMMESAEGRAKIKERLAPMIIGIVFVFCAANVVSAIITMSEGALGIS